MEEAPAAELGLIAGEIADGTEATGAGAVSVVTQPVNATSASSARTVEIRGKERSIWGEVLGIGSHRFCQQCDVDPVLAKMPSTSETTHAPVKRFRRYPNNSHSPTRRAR